MNATVSNPDATPEDETRILTLAELKELIETGKTDKIPNNKIIAEKLSVRVFNFRFFTPVILEIYRLTSHLNRRYNQEKNPGSSMKTKRHELIMLRGS